MTLLLTGGMRRPSCPQCGHGLEEISFVGLCICQGPWTHNLLLPKGDKMQIQLTTPLIDREAHFPDGVEQDSAALLVSAIAANAGIPTAGLTGGQLRQKDQGRSRVLVGYLKVRPEHYTKFAKCSGQQALNSWTGLVLSLVGVATANASQKSNMVLRTEKVILLQDLRKLHVSPSPMLTSACGGRALVVIKFLGVLNYFVMVLVGESISIRFMASLEELPPEPPGAESIPDIAWDKKWFATVAAFQQLYQKTFGWGARSYACPIPDAGLQVEV